MLLLGLLGVALVLGRSRRCGPPELRLALGLSLILTIHAARFLVFDAALLAASAALLWPAELAPGVAGRLATALDGAGAIALAWFGAADSGQASHELTTPSKTCDVRGRVPPGFIIFTDDLFRTAELWAHLPEHRFFIVAYDPAIRYGRSSAKYWRWHHLVNDETLCDAPECLTA